MDSHNTIRRKEGDLDGIDWGSFDEIALDGPAYRFALAIYQKPRLIADLPRGVRPPEFHPRCLVIEVLDQYSVQVRDRLKALIAPHVNDLGWLPDPR